MKRGALRAPTMICLLLAACQGVVGTSRRGAPEAPPADAVTARVIAAEGGDASADEGEEAQLWREIDDYVSGYPAERPVDKPGGVEDDLARSFPKPDALFPALLPKRLPELKKKLYEKTHLKLATSYQGVFMWPSDVLVGKDFAAGGLFLFEGSWDPLNPGKDYQGGVVFSVIQIHTYGDAAPPLGVFLQTGSAIANDALYADIGWAVGNLFWEQWFKKERFVVRLGQLQAINLLDFFRYADVRTSFSGPALGFPAGSIPFGPPGLGVAFKWWPREDSGLYVDGVVNDINSVLDEFDWAPIFETGEVFAGIEVGHNWKRKVGKGVEFDHVHLTIFYGDAPSGKPFPAEAGGGVKVAGEKQWGRWVGFASYTYNNARGGGFGLTFYKHAVNVGAACNKPLGIRGELAGAVTWVEALDGGNCGVFRCEGGDQFGAEVYWKVLITPDFWLTPGLQVAFQPLNNPDKSVIYIPQFKFRLFF